MKIRHDGKYTDINIDEIGEEIEDIFDKYITEKTGVTISHDVIYRFIMKFIIEHNKEEVRKEGERDRVNGEWDRVNKSLDKWKEESVDNKPKQKYLRFNR